MVAQPTIQNATRYKVLYCRAARQWMSKQTEFIRQHVHRSIMAAAYCPLAASDHIFRQYIWRDRCNGNKARRIKMVRPKPGIRAICYIVDHSRELVIIKLAWRDENPYEDQG